MSIDQNNMQSNEPNRLQAEQNARFWCEKTHANELNREEQEAFRVWLRASPLNARAYAELEQMWRDLTLLEEVEDLAAIKTNDRQTPSGIFEKALRALKWRPVMVPAVGAAFSLLFAMGVVMMLVSRPQWDVYQTAIGQVEEITLADGSVVTLDADSELRILYLSQERRLELAQGGAYFDVASNRERPFIVSAGSAQIRVLGTEFDVVNLPNGTKVSVLEGSVSVSSAVLNSRYSEMQKSQLSAGDQIVSARTGELSAVSTFEPDTVLSWQSGRFNFVDASLQEVVSRVNRYRESKIQIADEGLKDLRVNANFRVELSDQMLEALAASEPVSINEYGWGVVITKGTVSPIE